MIQLRQNTEGTKDNNFSEKAADLAAFFTGSIINVGIIANC